MFFIGFWTFLSFYHKQILFQPVLGRGLFLDLSTRVFRRLVPHTNSTSLCLVLSNRGLTEPSARPRARLSRVHSSLSEHSSSSTVSTSKRFAGTAGVACFCAGDAGFASTVGAGALMPTGTKLNG